VSRSALVTGVTGFIGGKLAERLLRDGWTVHALLRESSSDEELPAGLELHRHDGTFEGLARIVRTAAPDVVFHLASLYLADHRPDEVDALIASNVLFPVQLVEAMTVAGAARLVNTGTAWQHFGTDGYNPVNLYAATKQAFMDVLLYYHDARGLSVVTLKLFDTYGPGDKRRKLVQLLIDAALSGEALDMSPGEQVVDLTHIDDVVEAFMIAGDSVLRAEVPLNADHLLSGERFTVRELALAVSQTLGRSVHARFGERPYRSREVMIPVVPDPASLLLPWRRTRDVRSTLAELTHDLPERPL
jgi:nucleoside-diphosphate-sugar epimerase